MPTFHGIILPEPQDLRPHDLCVFLNKHNQFCYYTSGMSSYNSLENLINGTGSYKALINFVEQHSSGYRFVPTIGSINWDIMVNTHKQYIDTASITEVELESEEATISNEHAFKIIFEAGQTIVLPPAAPTNFSKQGCSTLDEAYEVARAYAQRMRMETNLGKPERKHIKWTYWPYKNSTAYKDLLARYTEWQKKHWRGRNDTNVASFNELLSLIFEGINLKEDGEPALRKAVMYMTYMKYGAEKHRDAYINMRERLLSHIKASTNLEYLKADDDTASLVCPIAPILVHKDRSKASKKQAYTRKWISLEANRCINCREWWRRGHLTRVASGDRNWYCTDCIDDLGYFRCNLCDGNYHRQGELCPQVAIMPPEKIYGYSQDVRVMVPQFFKTKNDKKINGAILYYGLELEVLALDESNLGFAAKKVGTAIRGHAIMKTDSSIGRNGFEIVTAPATLEYHKKHLWNDFFELGPGLVAAKTVRSWNTGVCGLHVHLTRAALTPMQLSKLLVFYNEPPNSEFLSKIAGRLVGPKAQYCKATKKRLGYNKEQGLGTPDYCSDHHDAITISRRNNGKTAEVRIFRGNCSKHGIMRALEFVDATVQWCGQNSGAELHFTKFLDWFKQNSIRSQYPELRKFLIQLGYIKSRIKKVEFQHFDKVPEAQVVA